MKRACPKYRALMAHQSGLLSAGGDRRIRRHLSGCETCREALGAMDVFEESAEWIREEEPPAICWDRVESSLEGIARWEGRRARFRRSPILLGAVVIAAAAAAMLWVDRGLHDDPEPEPTLARQEPSMPVDEPAVPASVVASLTAVSGCAVGEAGGECLRVGSAISQGDTLSLQGAAEAHLRIGEGTGVVLDRGAQLRFSELVGGSTLLMLSGGRVSSEVASLSEGASYEVRAGSWTVRVRGTRFAVELREDALDVQVDEGVVEVLREDGLAERLAAPARWSSTSAVAAGVADPTPVPVARGLGAESLQWPVLRLPALDYIDRWEIDGSTLGGAAGELAMRVPSGPLTIVGFGPDGDEFRALVEVGEGEVLLEATLLAQSSADGRRAPEGHLAPEVISRVVRQGLPGLRQCYERALRRSPEQEGRFRMRVSVGRSGQVRSVRVRAAQSDLPQSLRDCISARAERWVFPAPSGGAVTFDVPLAFARAGR